MMMYLHLIFDTFDTIGSSLLNPDSSIVKEDDFRQNPKIDDYLNRLIRKIFPELEPVDEPTLQSIREKIGPSIINS